MKKGLTVGFVMIVLTIIVVGGSSLIGETIAGTAGGRIFMGLSAVLIILIVRIGLVKLLHNDQTRGNGKNDHKCW